jgi:hypothetical protein
MGIAIYFFAGTEDNKTLCDFAASLGLSMLPILMEQPAISPSDDPAKGPFCYLSPFPRGELHPYGRPPKISAATDPLIEFLRSYRYAPDALVMGRVYCSDDVPAFVPITKPYFTKIADWIRRDWAKVPGGQHIGPEAKSLLQGGTRLLQLPPNVKVRQVYVGQSRKGNA